MLNRNFAAFLFYTRPRMLAILALGFSSGLPLALTAGTLSIWLAESGVSKSAIGLFAAIGTPYALKFLWAPLVDGLRLPLIGHLGRRKSWLLLSQIMLIASLVALGFSDPASNPWMTALCALFVAISSATQDIVIDAYRVEILPHEEQGGGAGALVLGYRFGMIVAGAGALFLAASLGWTLTYMIMAALVPIGFIAAIFVGEPVLAAQAKKSASGAAWLRDHVIEPFADFMTREAWPAILLFILLYKFSDAFMGIMTNPFLIEIGFVKEQIAKIVKLYGVIATIVGSLAGGALVMRIGVMRSLWICGILQALTNLAFVMQARIGADEAFLALTITMENISGGMGSAAFVAFISNLCNKQFTATQYALLSAFASFGRTWLSTPAGWVAEKLGWEWFFAFSALLAIPGLVVLFYLQKKHIHITAT